MILRLRVGSRFGSLVGDLMEILDYWDILDVGLQRRAEWFWYQGPILLKENWKARILER